MAPLVVWLVYMPEFRVSEYDETVAGILTVLVEVKV